MMSYSSEVYDCAGSKCLGRSMKKEYRMFLPRSSAGYGSFHACPHPARPQARRIAVMRAPRIAAKYNRPHIFGGIEMGFLSGKRILVTGLLSNRSIAYGIAKASRREGAELAFTYQNDRFRDRVTDMAAEFDSKLVFPCDVANDSEIADLFSGLAKA